MAALSDQQLNPMRPAEFCALERQLVAGMAMRKKRNVKMELAQRLKVGLLEHIEALDPEPAQFTAALGEAILAVSDGMSTGPAQAVASDLHMDWEMACTSPGFIAWLRQAAAAQTARTPRTA
jgi:hypothetical protein